MLPRSLVPDALNPFVGRHVAARFDAEERTVLQIDGLLTRAQVRDIQRGGDPVRMLRLEFETEHHKLGDEPDWMHTPLAEVATVRRHHGRLELDLGRGDRVVLLHGTGPRDQC